MLFLVPMHFSLRDRVETAGGAAKVSRLLGISRPGMYYALKRGTLSPAHERRLCEQLKARAPLLRAILDHAEQSPTEM